MCGPRRRRNIWHSHIPSCELDSVDVGKKQWKPLCVLTRRLDDYAPAARSLLLPLGRRLMASTSPDEADPQRTLGAAPDGIHVA